MGCTVTLAYLCNLGEKIGSPTYQTSFLFDEDGEFAVCWAKVRASALRHKGKIDVAIFHVAICLVSTFGVAILCLFSSPRLERTGRNLLS